MMKPRYRRMAFLLALILCLGLSPVSAWAEETAPTPVIEEETPAESTSADGEGGEAPTVEVLPEPEPVEEPAAEEPAVEEPAAEEPAAEEPVSSPTEEAAAPARAWSRKEWWNTMRKKLRRGAGGR